MLTAAPPCRLTIAQNLQPTITGQLQKSVACVGGNKKSLRMKKLLRHSLLDIEEYQSKLGMKSIDFCRWKQNLKTNSKTVIKKIQVHCVEISVGQ